MTRAAAAPGPAANPSLTGSVDPAEIAKFSALAEAGGIRRKVPPAAPAKSGPPRLYPRPRRRPHSAERP